MKLTLHCLLILMLHCNVFGQYEDGLFGTTGPQSLENAVKEGDLVVVGKLLENAKSGHFSGMGRINFFDVPFEVSQTLYGQTGTHIRCSYNLYTKSKKLPDGKFKILSGLHEAPVSGSPLIAVGKASAKRFDIKRFIPLTTENLERVTKLIMQYHGEKKAGETQVDMAEAPQSTPSKVTQSPPTEQPSQSRAGYSQIYLWVGAVLVLLAGLLLRRRIRRP